MLYEYTIRTQREGFINVTSFLRESLEKSGVSDGICLAYCPHTTAGMTSMKTPTQMSCATYSLRWIKRFLTGRNSGIWKETSAAHLKASALGSSVTVPIENGQLVLGVWQGVYLCEFDGPRSRKLLVKILG